MSSLRHVEHCISRQQAYVRLNAFTQVPSPDFVRNAATTADAVSHTTSTSLAGRLVSLKDNIASIQSAAEKTTCASKVLSNYVSPYPSTVATLLSQAGAIVSGKTNMDEFGMGSHSQSPHAGPITSHLLPPAGEPEGKLSAGGSSGGSAVAVATGQCFAALGTDTGGSVRLPAAWTGITGFKPSYGRISRWGVVDYANSLDTVGILASSISDTTSIFHTLDAFDPQDPTSLSASTRERINTSVSHRPTSRTLRIGVPTEWNTRTLNPLIRQTWTHLLTTLQSNGHTLVPISLPTTPLALGAYYILAPAEASSNLARYDGLRYGHRGPDSDFASTRSAFGPEVRRRILLGTYTLSSAAMENYFRAAQRVRRAVQRDFDRAFKMGNPLLEPQSDDTEKGDSGEGVDVLIGPTAPTLPPALEEVQRMEPFEAYTADALTVPASLAGLPALSVPVGVPGLSREVVDGVDTRVWSAGMQVVGQFGDDEMVLEVGKLVEEIGRGQM